MLHKLDAIRYQDVSELHKMRDSVIKHLNELSEELNRINSDVEKTTAQLNASRRRFAVTEKEIKDNEGEIFHLNTKRIEMDQGASLLLKEIESTEAELTELNNSKDALNISIKNIELGIQETSDAVAVLKDEKQEVSSRADQMEAEKCRLSDDISESLSKTSLERDKVESQLNDLNTAFLHNITERDALKKRLPAEETTIGQMTEAISGPERKVASLEEVKCLQSERRSLKADVEKQERESLSVATKLQEPQKVLADKQKQTDMLSTENAELEKTTVSLEGEVRIYDEALSAVNTVRERSKRSLGLVKQSEDEMITLLIDKVRLEHELRMAGEKVNMMIRIMRAISS